MNGHSNNPDGAGLAIARGGKIEVIKGMFPKFEDFWKVYKQHEKHSMILHFRLATHGAKDEANCHPWTLNEGDFALVHNGIISIKLTDATLSDTGNFCRLVLEPMLRHNKPTKPALRYLIEQAVGSSNKILLINRAGQVTIFNESAGEWHKGAWFSNTGYAHKANYCDWRPWHDEDICFPSSTARATVKSTVPDIGFLRSRYADTAPRKLWNKTEIAERLALLEAQTQADTQAHLDQGHEEDVQTAMHDLNMLRGEAETWLKTTFTE